MKINDVTFAHVFGYFPWPAKVLEVKEKTVTVCFFHTMEINTVKKTQTTQVTAQSIRKYENKYGERKGFSDALKQLYAFSASHGLQFCPEESSLRAVKNPLSGHAYHVAGVESIPQPSHTYLAAEAHDSAVTVPIAPPVVHNAPFYAAIPPAPVNLGPAPADTVTHQRILAPVRTHSVVTPQVTQIVTELNVVKYDVDVPVAVPLEVIVNKHVPRPYTVEVPRPVEVPAPYKVHPVQEIVETPHIHTAHHTTHSATVQHHAVPVATSVAVDVHTSISSNILNDECKKGHASMPPSDPPSPQLYEIVSSQVVRTREPLGVSAFEALLTPLSSAPVDPVNVAETSGLSTDSPTCDPPPPNAPVNPVKVAKPVATQQLVPESSGQGKDVLARKLQLTSAGLSGPARPDQTKSISLKRKSTEQKLNDLNKSMADNLENILTPVAPKKNKQIKNVGKEKNVCKGRPVNPYILYFNDRQAIIKQENPNIVHKEISKIVGVEWASLKSDNPDKYLEYQTIYQKNLESYKSSKDANLKNNDIENAVSDEKDLKRENDQLKEENDQLKEENEIILKENLHLKRQNSGMQKEIEQLKEQKQNLEKEKNNLKKAYSQSKEVVEKLIKK